MEYDTPKSTMHCARTGRELQEKEPFWSVLYDRNGQFEREDFSEDAWQGPPEDAFCVWRTRVPAKEPKPRRPLVDDQVMLDVFTRLADQEDPDKVNFRYILALLLMRRRILKLERTRRKDGREFMVFFCRRTDSQHEVLDPHLTPTEIVAVEQEVGKVLNTDV